MSGTGDPWTDTETLVDSQRLAGSEAGGVDSQLSVSAFDIQELIDLRKGRIDYKFTNLKEETGLNWDCLMPRCESGDWCVGIACDTDPFLGKKGKSLYCFTNIRPCVSRHPV